MLLQTLEHFERQVQTWKIRIRIFEQIHHAHTLPIVIEPAVLAHAFGQHLLARMSKRRVSQIVRKRDCFPEIFVEA